jgi:hypothetical protein
MTTTITRSPRTRVVVRTNYYQNPANANPVNGLHGSATAYATGAAAGAYAIATGNFQQMTTTALPAGTRFGYYMDVLVNAPAGTQVAAAIYFQTRTGPAPIRFWIDCYTAGGAQVGHSDVISSAASTTLNVGVTTTDAITRVRYYVFFDNSTAAAMAASSIQVARYMVELGVPVAGAFFWGGQAASGTVTYAWLGSPSNAPSAMIDNNPADVLTPLLMLGYEMTRESGNNNIDVPGASAPVTVLHPTKKRTGTISLLLANEAQAVACDALLSQTAAFVLADTGRAIAGMTFTLDRGGLKVKLDADTRRRFTADIQVVEQ